MNRFAWVLLALALHGSADAQSIIPHPKHVVFQEGRLLLGDSFQWDSGPVAAVRQAHAGWLPERLVAVLPTFQKSEGGSSRFSVIQVDDLDSPEAYRLQIDREGITIQYQSPAGVFYAGQTLLQLADPGVFAAKSGRVQSLPFVEIEDAPRFGWRGLMLDSSRHFQTVDEVLRFIDLMAIHKLNVFHWHLTDGHGWRLESKKFPELTTKGAWRIQPGYPEEGKAERYGGFYSQADMKRVVAYAQARHIKIVPEVDMPGHCFAFVAAYPELGCLGHPQETDRLFTYPADAQRFPPVPGTDVLCVGKDETLRVCLEILDEVMAIFPGEFIHIGGDEVKKSFWRDCDDCQQRIADESLANEDELQSWFIRKLDAHITKGERRLIGWDEILEGGLAKNATVMSWRGDAGGIQAAGLGHDAVMSPGTHCYLDHGQSHSPLEPAHWPGHENVEHVYGYEPIPRALNPKDHARILGLQGNVWTAFIHEEWLIDLQTWPRACAIAEIGWTPKGQRDFGRFRRGLLAEHLERLDALGVNYWWEEVLELGAWDPSMLDVDSAATEMRWDLSTQWDGLSGRELPITFQYLNGAHGLAIQKVEWFVNGEVVATVVQDGFAGAEHRNHQFLLPSHEFKSGQRIELVATAFGDGGTDSFGSVTVVQVATRRVR